MTCQQLCSHSLVAEDEDDDDDDADDSNDRDKNRNDVNK